MPLEYLPNGNLVVGKHQLTWESFVKEYGYTLRRKELIKGLELLMTHLSICGCRTIYIDGSFVTKNRTPGDYDACWDDSDNKIDWEKLRTEYKEICNGAEEMTKMKYKGHVRAAYSFADWENSYIDFFQKDKEDKSPKGIIRLSI